jgi:hypothetical protein
MGGEILTFELARMPNQAFEPTSYLGGSIRRYTFFLPVIIKVDGQLTLPISRWSPKKRKSIFSWQRVEGRVGNDSAFFVNFT